MLVLLTPAGQLTGNQTGSILIHRGPTVHLVSLLPVIYFYQYFAGLAWLSDFAALVLVGVVVFHWAWLILGRRHLQTDKPCRCVINCPRENLAILY